MATTKGKQMSKIVRMAKIVIKCVRIYPAFANLLDDDSSMWIHLS